MLNPKTFLLAIACLCSLIHVHASTYDVQMGDLRYSVDTGTMEAAVFASNTDISGDVVIPASIEADPDSVMRTYSVTSIGNSAFQSCFSLTSVTIPNSVTSIGDWAFEGCSSLTSVTIPNSVTSIGEYAFEGCSSLTSVTIPNSVTSIGKRAFWDCSSLTSVTIPNSVTSIGEYAFEGCSSLTSIEVESGNPSYASFDGILYSKGMIFLLRCPGRKTAVDIPNSVTYIENSAFEGCSSLTSVTIPESVTYIGSWAFWGCSSLTSVAIPNSVTYIGDNAFIDCSSLASVTIPNSVTSIGEYAFYGCTNLEKIYCMWETPITCVQSVWDDAHYSNATLYVPEGCIPAYQVATPWSSFLKIEEHAISGIDPTTALGNEAKTIVATYDINGRKVNVPVNGINIIRYSDGTTRKVVVRNPQ